MTMELLTPDNLASFVEKAQQFLDAGPVGIYQVGVWYGEGRTTVKVVRQGQTLTAEFTLGGTTWSVAAYPEGAAYPAYYRVMDDRLEIDQPIEGRSELLVMQRKSQ